LHGCVVLVVDATTGVGRRVTSQLCALGAAVAVVGAGHPGRDDDAATNAAFLCKELAGIGLIALPYQADVERPESFRALTGQIAADIGPVTASVVVVPAGSGGGGSAPAFRVLSGVVAASLPAGAKHIEVDVGRDGFSLEKTAQAVVERLVRRHERWRAPSG
jgi:NAD(P)-dependent dehydrogenase (short-subunit alcohol dehydrogenase family)